MADQKRELEKLSGLFSSGHPSLKAKFLAQLSKDLQHDFPELELKPLRNEVTAVVQAGIEAGRLEEILYRVDLPESKALKSMAHEYPAQQLAHLIMERIAQKVLFRWQYSSGS